MLSLCCCLLDLPVALTVSSVQVLKRRHFPKLLWRWLRCRQQAQGKEQYLEQMDAYEVRSCLLSLAGRTKESIKIDKIGTEQEKLFVQTLLS